MIDHYEIQRRIEGMYAPVGSEEGQEAIRNNPHTHISEVWEDGEITFTKTGVDGDLYGARSTHQSEPPLLPQGQLIFPREVFENDDDWLEVHRGNKHKKMIVLDDELKDILAEYREVQVDQTLIEHLKEVDPWAKPTQ